MSETCEKVSITLTRVKDDDIDRGITNNTEYKNVIYKLCQ